MRNKQGEDSQERAKAKIDLPEERVEQGDHGDEDDEPAEARDELLNHDHEQVAAVIVHRRHRANAVPRARDEAHQVHICKSKQRDDLVARAQDSRHRYIVVGDGSIFGGRSNISICQTMRGKKAETN